MGKYLIFRTTDECQLGKELTVGSVVREMAEKAIKAYDLEGWCRFLVFAVLMEMLLLSSNSLQAAHRSFHLYI